MTKPKTPSKSKKKASKKKASKKTKKKASKTVGVKKKAPPIKKHVYVVEEIETGHLVRKISNEGSTDEKEVYTVDKDGVCDCKASEFGTDCKHVGMANGSLTFGLVPKAQAEEILETYIEQVLRPRYPNARIVSLVEYRKDAELGSAAALMCGTLGESSAEKLTLWTISPENLLLRIHCFRDLDRYRRALSSVRRKAFNIKAAPEQANEQVKTSDAYEDPDGPSGDVGAVGKTYGNQGEDS